MSPLESKNKGDLTSMPDKKKPTFGLIRLNKKPSVENIGTIRNESWISGNPDERSSNTDQPLTSREKEICTSPVRRIGNRIHLHDPKLVHRIIFDPALEQDPDPE